VLRKRQLCFNPSKFTEPTNFLLLQIPELRLVSCWLGVGISSSLITLLQHFERIHIAYVDISPSDICLLKDYYANMPPTVSSMLFLLNVYL